MLKLWTIREKYSGDKQAMALGVTIAKHLSIDMLRGRRCSQLDDIKISDSQYCQPDSRLESQENELWLKMQLDRLPSTEYSVLHLRQVGRDCCHRWHQRKVGADAFGKGEEKAVGGDEKKVKRERRIKNLNKDV